MTAATSFLAGHRVAGRVELNWPACRIEQAGDCRLQYEMQPESKDPPWFPWYLNIISEAARFGRTVHYCFEEKV